MRQMLSSIQQITLGIGTGNKAMIIKAAPILMIRL
jgi:hypothetical protein